MLVARVATPTAGHKTNSTAETIMALCHVVAKSNEQLTLLSTHTALFIIMTHSPAPSASVSVHHLQIEAIQQRRSLPNYMG
jgi:hypothetical protein